MISIAITFDDALLQKIIHFTEHGGRIILSGSSGMFPDKSGFAIDIGVAYTGKQGPYEPDYILPPAHLDPELVSSPFVVYDKPFFVKACKATAIAGSRTPYFNRTPEHFCSHQHTPYRPEPNTQYDAVMQYKNMVYFAHPIFLSYYKSCHPQLKYLFRGVLNTILPKRRLHVRMPSCGRITLQYGDNTLLLHLFCAQPQLRGNDVLLQNSHQKIEIIEDIMPMTDVECRIKLTNPPDRVYSAHSGKDIAYSFHNSYLILTLKRVYIHELVVIKTPSPVMTSPSVTVCHNETETQSAEKPVTQRRFL